MRNIATGPDLPIPNAETGVLLLLLLLVSVDFLDFFSFGVAVEDQVTALAARDSGAMLLLFPLVVQSLAAESNASVISESSIPPVPVDINTAHFPTAASNT